MRVKKDQRSRHRFRRRPKSSVAHERSRKPHYARWRALTLSLVYVLFALHILHWKLTGRTLAPLELNEVMYTLELGIITAGFLFMAFLVLGTMIFGRFFCSWACHIMVLQDLCGYFLRKIGIRAKPLRSRLLLLVPPLTAAYMFLWPQLVRMWHDRGIPTFHWATDADGWASVVTLNFWRNLPGPWIIAITFFVCGFLMVYLLGSRTFCTYVCPYGAVFALADRLSPGRIRVNDDCQQCARCTAACTSGIRVHEEVHKHGMVINPACMKDLDCVSVCPQQALRYGFGRPAGLKSFGPQSRFGLPYSFSMREEVLMAAVFLIVLLTFRGLYGRVPFLLSLALGGIIGYLSVASVRLIGRPTVALASLTLKRNHHFTRWGVVYSGLMLFVCAFIAHSAFVRYHEYRGLHLARTLPDQDAGSRRSGPADRALMHLTTAERWGLFYNPNVKRGLVSASMARGGYEEAVRYARDFLTRYPKDPAVRWSLCRSLLALNRFNEAKRQLRIITDDPGPYGTRTRIVEAAHESLAELLSNEGDYEGAVSALEHVIALDPKRASAQARLGSDLAELGRIDEAIAHLRLAVDLNPTLGQAQYNLGTLLAHQERYAEAIPFYEKAADLLSDDADVANNLGYALMQTGAGDRAGKEFERALTLHPDHADAHFNLAMISAGHHHWEEAREHLRTAARLDPRYVRFLSGSGQTASDR